MNVFQIVAHAELDEVFYEPGCIATISPVASHSSSFCSLLSICEYSDKILRQFETHS